MKHNGLKPPLPECEGWWLVLRAGTVRNFTPNRLVELELARNAIYLGENVIASSDGEVEYVNRNGNSTSTYFYSDSNARLIYSFPDGD
jgi:hypothetical protein